MMKKPINASHQRLETPAQSAHSEPFPNNSIDPDCITLRQAGRIFAPVCNGVTGSRFEDAERQILGFLEHSSLRRTTNSAFPSHPFQSEIGFKPFCQEWFSKLAQLGRDTCDNPERRSAFGNWGREMIKWWPDNLLVSRVDLTAEFGHLAGEWHSPARDVMATSHWNFAQALAWVATRDETQVARISYSQHWNNPIQEGERLGYLCQNPDARRQLIGWLLLDASINHCKCGLTPKPDSEPWESCQCLYAAYEALRIFAEEKGWIVPIYRATPSQGNFELDWTEESHKILLPRGEVQSRWPVTRKSWSETKMRTWIRDSTFSNQRSARTAFMQMADTDGLSAAFEAAWKMEYPNRKRGRPKNPKSGNI